MHKQTILEKIRDLFNNAARNTGNERVSKHASGRHPFRMRDRRAERRAHNKAARKMRAIQRRRDRQSSKRQRS